MQISVQVAKQILILFWQGVEMQIGIYIGEQRIGTGKAVFSCISGDPRNAGGVYYQLTSGKSEMQTHVYVFWAALNGDGVSQEEKSARKRCGLLSLFILIDTRRLIRILRAAKMQMELPGTKCRQMTVSHKQEFPVAFCDGSKMQIGHDRSLVKQK